MSHRHYEVHQPSAQTVDLCIQIDNRAFEIAGRLALAEIPYDLEVVTPTIISDVPQPRSIPLPGFRKMSAILPVKTRGWELYNQDSFAPLEQRHQRPAAPNSQKHFMLGQNGTVYRFSRASHQSLSIVELAPGHTERHADAMSISRVTLQPSDEQTGTYHALLKQLEILDPRM
jgi:hypothetical protein